MDDDPWTDIADDEAVPVAGWPIVSLARVAELAWQGPLGLRLASDDPVEQAAPHLARVSLVTVAFPKFRDGRGYTTARLLRERYGYTGELRAVGDVLRDQLWFLLRCGFDAFALKDADPRGALDGLSRHPAPYQPGADGAPPIWVRRDQR